MISPYSIRDKIMVLKTVTHAFIVMYFLISDSKYSLCDIRLHISLMCLLKFSRSSRIKPRYLYEHTLSSTIPFRDIIVSVL